MKQVATILVALLAVGVSASSKNTTTTAKRSAAVYGGQSTKTAYQPKPISTYPAVSSPSYSAQSSYSAPAAPASYSAPAAPVSYSAPAAPVSYSAPAAPVSYSAPAAPVSYSAPAAPASYSAPAAPASYSAPAAPASYSAPAAYSPSTSFPYPTPMGMSYQTPKNGYSAGNNYQAPSYNNGPPVPITSFNHNIKPVNHEYDISYTTGNGISSQEYGFLKNVPVYNNGNNYGDGYSSDYQTGVANVKVGATTWCSPEGILFTLQYTADENGYNPTITQGSCSYQQNSYSTPSYKAQSRPQYK